MKTDSKVQSPDSNLTPPDLQARRQSVASTLGTHAMEGLIPDAATMSILRRYEGGELTLGEFSAAMNAHAESLIGTRQYLAGAA